MHGQINSKKTLPTCTFDHKASRTLKNLLRLSDLNQSTQTQMHQGLWNFGKSPNRRTGSNSNCCGSADPRRLYQTACCTITSSSIGWTEHTISSMRTFNANQFYISNIPTCHWCGTVFSYTLYHTHFKWVCFCLASASFWSCFRFSQQQQKPNERKKITPNYWPLIKRIVVVWC